MTPTLRDALAAARINRMKARIARDREQRQRDAEAEAFPVCEGCGKRHARGSGLVDLLRGLQAIDDEPQPVPPGAPKQAH